MGWDGIFGVASAAAMLGWAVLILAPRRMVWLGVLPRMAIPLALSVLYSGLVMVYLAGAGGGFDSIAGVRALFASDPVLVAGWTHYLAFDLLVGGFLATRLDAAGIHRLLQAPILLAVFMLGPLGFLLGILTEQASLLMARRALGGA